MSGFEVVGTVMATMHYAMRIVQSCEALYHDFERTESSSQKSAFEEAKHLSSHCLRIRELAELVLSGNEGIFPVPVLVEYQELLEKTGSKLAEIEGTKDELRIIGRHSRKRRKWSARLRKINKELSAALEILHPPHHDDTLPFIHPGEIAAFKLDFDTDQWTNLALDLQVGQEKCRQTELGDNTTLPIVDREKLGSGGSATVWKVQIHSPYQNLHEFCEPPVFVLKSYDHFSSKAYENEREALQAMSKRSHPHKAKLVAIYNQGSLFNLAHPQENPSIHESSMARAGYDNDIFRPVARRFKTSTDRWWRCCNCDREVHKSVWGNNCPDCGRLKVDGERSRVKIDIGSDQDWISADILRQLGLSGKDRHFDDTKSIKNFTGDRGQAPTVAGKSESVNESTIGGIIRSLMSNLLTKGARVTTNFSRLAPSLLLFAAPASASPTLAKDCTPTLHRQIANFLRKYTLFHKEPMEPKTLLSYIFLETLIIVALYTHNRVDAEQKYFLGAGMVISCITGAVYASTAQDFVLQYLFLGCLVALVGSAVSHAVQRRWERQIAIAEKEVCFQDAEIEDGLIQDEKM